jgi:hypothetical protein
LSTYVKFHQTSLTPAKVGDARVKKKATQVNHMTKCKTRGLWRERTGEKKAGIKWGSLEIGSKGGLLKAKHRMWANVWEIQHKL